MNTDIDLYDNEFDDFNRRIKRGSKRKYIKRRPKVKRRQKITLYDYLASRVPADAHFTINKYGRYRRARNEQELAYQLRDFVRTFGEKGLIELAQIHPDRKLLDIHLENCNCEKCFEKRKNKMMSEFANQQRMFNATGTKVEQVDTKGQKEGLLILGGFVLMGLALILKK
tara:strand:+ start:4189 stop:4698 length:510 start_codon:yes stop_codon:yes gene_type:complete